MSVYPKLHKKGTRVQLIESDPDSPIYYIERWVNHFLVDLTYKNKRGDMVRGGSVGRWLLREVKGEQGK